MKFFFWKYYVGIALMVIISVAHADEIFSDDVFSYIVIKQPVYSPPNRTPWSAVISTQEEWEQLFNSWQGDFSPRVPAPLFDFEQYQLIAGGFGEKISGGYLVVVDRVDELGNAVYVSVLDISPSPKCLVDMGFTSPSATILIKKTTKPIKFSITKVVRECAS